MNYTKLWDCESDRRQIPASARLAQLCPTDRQTGTCIAVRGLARLKEASAAGWLGDVVAQRAPVYKGYCPPQVATEDKEVRWQAKPRPAPFPHTQEEGGPEAFQPWPEIFL